MEDRRNEESSDGYLQPPVLEEEGELLVMYERKE